MKQSTLIRRLARETGLSRADAADQLDSLVGDILARIRRGKSKSIKGLGSFYPDTSRTVRFVPGKGAR
jgi:nucleoid DNA-binding protein